jgi:hypothetical protein
MYIKHNLTKGLHRHKVHPLYQCWQDMKRRCYSPACAAYRNYGARGISVCKEWHDSTTFIIWAMSSGYKEGLQLDRRDNNGNYTPDNCRWVTSLVNSLNKRTNHLVTAFGETKPLSAWYSDPRTIVSKSTLKNRILTGGWDGERAITTPKLNRGPRMCAIIDGEVM